MHRAALPRLVVFGAALLGMAGCGATPVATPMPTQPASAPITVPPDKDFAGRVAIEGGRHLYLHCRGTGAPAVVLESGDGSGHPDWNGVIEAGLPTRTCAYDRLGVGGSDNATGCRDLDDLRGDLEQLLRAARLGPPYVLAGASGGGYLAAGFALAHPDQVAGLMLLDTFPALDPRTAPPEVLAETACDHPDNDERRDYVAVEHAAWDHRREIPGLALTVLTNDYGDQAADAYERNSVRGQRGWLTLSPQGRQVVVGSGHNIPGNEPDLVARELGRLVEAAR